MNKVIEADFLPPGSQRMLATKKNGYEIAGRD